jgi:monovalent cation:H+ antiporter-2, CPA2 family
VNADSGVLGKKFADLHISPESDVHLLAMRRDGKFIIAPDYNTDLRLGDQVLLCGNLSSLHHLQPLLANSTPPLSISYS